MFFVLASSAWAGGGGLGFTGEIWSGRKSELTHRFDYQSKSFPDRHREVRARFTRTDGALELEETLIYEANGKLRSYDFDQPVLKIFSKVTFSQEAIDFEQKKWGDTKKITKERPQGPVLVIDEVPPFVRDHWESFSETAPKETRLPFTYVVADRMDMFAFTLRRAEKQTSPTRVTIVMQAESPIIRMFVAPAELDFEKYGEHRLLESRGPLPVRSKVDGQWLPLVGRLVLKRDPIQKPIQSSDPWATTKKTSIIEKPKKKITLPEASSNSKR